MHSRVLFLSLVSSMLCVVADSSSPCTSGTCTYQSGDGSNTAYSVLAINTEKPSSLSDITAAAGWDIIECDPYSIGPQDIRLVCTDRPKGCDQLFEDGEENTIVRLPDNCAGGPFARVVKSWIPEDQSLPARLLKRQLDSPVRALTLDFDFARIPESNGKVYITASATNSQVQRNALTRSAAKRSLQPLRHASRAGQANAIVRTFVDASKRASSKSRRRGFFDFIDSAVGTVSDAAKDTVNTVGDVVNQVGNTVGDVANQVGDKVEAVANQVGDKVGDVANQVGDTLGNVGNAIVDGAQDTANAVQDGIVKVGDSIGEIIDDATGAVAAFVDSADGSTNFNETISKNLRVLDINESFPVFSASLSCPAQGEVPAFDTSISVTAAVKAQLDAEVGFIVVGSIVPPKVDDLAFTAVLNGTVGAEFDVKAGAKGTLDTGLIPLFQIGLPGLSFPGILTVGPSISLNAQAKASLGVTADINVKSAFELPQVNLVFPPSQGESSATVTPSCSPLKVNVGASAELQARAEAHIIPQLDIGVDLLNGLAGATVFLNVDGSAGVDLTLKAAAEATPVSGTIDQPIVSIDDIETKFGGSVAGDVGVSINAGATAALPPFFDETVSVELFSKTFPIFKKEFGQLTKRLHVRQEQSGLTCPAAGEISAKQPILDEAALTPQQ
ncbi:hypothetical protein CPB86DRAFT_109040 [Serendipita vermifera]|nr:hypothetical protein CPB86DRAFT_109040 [Serendipita vermifera]